MNLPDDWSSGYVTCFECGSRFHASEGGCDNCYDEDEDSEEESEEE